MAVVVAMSGQVSWGQSQFMVSLLQLKLSPGKKDQATEPVGGCLNCVQLVLAKRDFFRVSYHSTTVLLVLVSEKKRCSQPDASVK